MVKVLELGGTQGCLSPCRVPPMAADPDDEPYDWWLGLAVTFVVGITVSAYVGALSANVVDGVMHGSPRHVLLSVPNALPGMLISWPVAFVLGTLPITFGYAVVRLTAPYFRMTLLRRLGIGLALGTAANILLLAVDQPFNLQTLQHGLMALRPPFFPYVEIEACAIVLAFVARQRWFGIAD